MYPVNKIVVMEWTIWRHIVGFSCKIGSRTLLAQIDP